ncbi:MAG: hypothetical protein AAFY16_10050, partial [Cyanobacteria bacterium J06642_3]
SLINNRNTVLAISLSLVSGSVFRYCHSLVKEVGGLIEDYYLVQQDNLSGTMYTFRYQLVQKYWQLSRGL